MAARSDKRKQAEEQVNVKERAFEQLADAMANAMRAGIITNAHVSYISYELFNAVHDRLEPF